MAVLGLTPRCKEISSLLDEDGAGDEVPLFESVPWQTLNDAPAVIGAEVIRKSYLKWIEWAEALGADPWAQTQARVLQGARSAPDRRQPATSGCHHPLPTDLARELVRRARAELHAGAHESILRLYLSITYVEAGG